MLESLLAKIDVIDVVQGGTSRFERAQDRLLPGGWLRRVSALLEH